jgi:hypothetical protein
MWKSALKRLQKNNTTISLSMDCSEPFESRYLVQEARTISAAPFQCMWTLESVCQNQIINESLSEYGNSYIT